MLCDGDKGYPFRVCALTAGILLAVVRLSVCRLLAVMSRLHKQEHQNRCRAGE